MTKKRRKSFAEQVGVKMGQAVFPRMPLRPAPRVIRTPQRWLICMHEAGHAVAAKLMRGDWCDMRLVHDFGGIVGTWLYCVQEFDTRHYVVRNVVVGLAGPYTEYAARVTWPRYICGTEEDERQVRILRPSVHEYELGMMLIRGMLHKHMPTIRKLARELDRKSWLRPPHVNRPGRRVLTCD